MGEGFPIIWMSIWDAMTGNVGYAIFLLTPITLGALGYSFKTVAALSITLHGVISTRIYERVNDKDEVMTLIIVSGIIYLVLFYVIYKGAQMITRPIAPIHKVLIDRWFRSS
jgi:hypothetical protein